MFRRMSLMRRFEERVIQLVERGEIVGAAHSYIGEEALAVGTCLALRDDDWITGNHRSHGHPSPRAAPCTWPTSAWVS